MQPTIAFIGAGNMARAIFGGLLATDYPAKNIFVTGRTRSKLDDIEQQGINVGTDNNAVIECCDIIVLAVKPQMMQQVVQSISQQVLQHKPLIISVAAGVSFHSIEQWLGGHASIVRCMPNTPALVQLGASGLCANEQTSVQEKQQAQQIIDATGVAVWVDTEAQLDTVTALSGSGPAYFFLMMESMIEAAVGQGLPREVAEKLALQTAKGAAVMAQQSDVSPTELRRRVTSPKGTTEQAILSFQRDNFETIIARGMQANTDRSKELSGTAK